MKITILSLLAAIGLLFGGCSGRLEKLPVDAPVASLSIKEFKSVGEAFKVAEARLAKDEAKIVDLEKRVEKLEHPRSHLGLVVGFLFVLAGGILGFIKREALKAKLVAFKDKIVAKVKELVAKIRAKFSKSSLAVIAEPAKAALPADKAEPAEKA